MKPIDKVLTLIYHNVTEPAGTDWTQDGNRKTKYQHVEPLRTVIMASLPKLGFVWKI